MPSVIFRIKTGYKLFLCTCRSVISGLGELSHFPGAVYQPGILGKTSCLSWCQLPKDKIEQKKRLDVYCFLAVK